MIKKTSGAVERVIACAEANMRAEGFETTREAKRDGRHVVSGRASANDLVESYVMKHKKITKS